jgi:hypothetical protein
VQKDSFHHCFPNGCNSLLMLAVIHHPSQIKYQFKLLLLC